MARKMTPSSPTVMETDGPTPSVAEAGLLSRTGPTSEPFVGPMSATRVIQRGMPVSAARAATTTYSRCSVGRVRVRLVSEPLGPVPGTMKTVSAGAARERDARTAA